jgi:hypothetical protein
VTRISNEAGVVTVTLEYGAADKRDTTREVFTLAHKRLGGLEVTDRRAA